jgi:hypothetical protein
MLRDIQAQAGAGGGVEVGAQGAGGEQRVAEPERDIGSGEEALRVAEIRQSVSGDQRVRSADEGAGLRIGGMGGADKAFLELGGETLIARAIARSVRMTL